MHAAAAMRKTSFAALLVLGACATPPASVPLPPRLGAGPVALAVSDREPARLLAPPTANKSEGAAKGAGTYALATLAGCGVLYGFFSGNEIQSAALGIVCGLALIGMPIAGGITGAAQTRPAEESAEAAEALGAAALAAAPTVALRNNIEAVAARHPERRLRVLTQMPASPGETEVLARSGYDSLVVVELNEIALVGSGFDPPMILRVRAQVRRQVLTGTEPVAEGTYWTEAGARKYSVWAADQGAALRAELGRALEDIAEQIVDSVPPSR
jgi:hypothetical protein